MRAATIHRLYVLCLTGRPWPAGGPPAVNTRFILIETSHAGNVGAVARAMKVMGFDDLVLVAPRWPDVLTREETLQRASGATDVLQRARVVATLDEALEGVSHLCATAMTPRDFGPPTAEPRAYLAALARLCADGGSVADATRLPAGAAGSTRPAGVAFLFGPERFGMANADVYRCHVALQIPTAPDYGSLNLAAAVQVIAYEWRQAIGGFAGAGASALADRDPDPDATQADAAAVAGLLAHWERALVDIGFLDPQAPKKLMPRLNRLFNRAGLTPEEVHILRGVAKAMEQAAPSRKP
jgi:tRNA/rRNA methyltransferase